MSTSTVSMSSQRKSVSADVMRGRWYCVRPMDEYRNLLEGVRSIARDAGKAILEVYEREFDVETKADRSPLTEADRVSHRIIVAGLAGLSPRLPVLSEEANDAEHVRRLEWPRYWLIDPLDGTKEFIK